MGHVEEASNTVEGSKKSENNRYNDFHPNVPLLEMNKINMTFD
jgi:hypothetical protein